MKRISFLLRGIGLIAGLCGVAAPFTMADLIVDWSGNYVTAANNTNRSNAGLHSDILFNTGDTATKTSGTLSL